MADTLISQKGQCPIDLPQGAPFEMEITCLDSSDQPVSLIGLEGRAEMHETAGGRLQLTFAIEVSHAASGDDKGKIWVRSTKTQNGAVKRDGVWDLELYDPADDDVEIPIFVESPVTLVRKVTQA